MPETLFEGVRIDSDQFKGSVLQTVVVSISATRVRNARQASWSGVSAGFVSASVQEIRELVAYKDAKVPTYLQRCHEVWLLIVGDGTSISSTLDLSEDVRQMIFPPGSREHTSTTIKGSKPFGCVPSAEPLCPAPYTSSMDHRERITIDPDMRGGKPCIRGMRITVYDVLGYLASGMSQEEIRAEFPYLEAKDIRARLAFVADTKRMFVSYPSCAKL